MRFAMRQRRKKNAKDKAALIRDAQKELQGISAAQHPKLVNALQARLLAMQGRGGDTEIAHVTPGEVVLPRSLQTPAIMQQIAAEARRQGLSTPRLAVGNRANSINPRTGQREFAIEEIEVTGIRPKPVYIPRVSNLPVSPGSPWGRVGEPSDEMAAVEITRQAESQGWNPVEAFKEYLRDMTEAELEELKETLRAMQALITLNGTLTQAELRAANAILLRFGFIATPIGAGVAISLVAAHGVAVYLVSNVIIEIDAILRDGTYRGGPRYGGGSGL
jgi:hypothetical protein